MSDKPKVTVYCRLANDVTPKTAIYCRVASADDSAIKTQRETLCNYALEKRLSVGMVYSDNGASGLSLERPAFQEMMSAVDRGNVNCIIVKNISRISRNHLHFGKWIDDMRGKNVRVITVDDNFDSQTYFVQSTSLEDAIRKHYKERHSQLTKSGIAHAKRRKLELAAKQSE